MRRIAIVSMLLGCASSPVDDAPDTTIAISASEDGSDSGGGDSGSDSDSDADSDPGFQGNCPTAEFRELVGTLELTTFRVGGQDRAMLYDPAEGGVACLYFRDDGQFRLAIDFGPKDGGDHESRLTLKADIAPRSYDLATEAGMEPGHVEIGYSITMGPGTFGWGSDNSPGVGTIDVVATAFDDPTFDVSAVGQIGLPEDGWIFDLRFVAEWADD